MDQIPGHLGCHSIMKLTEHGQKAWCTAELTQYFPQQLSVQCQKLRTSNLADIFRLQRVHTNKSRLKIWEKLEHGRIQGLPNF